MINEETKINVYYRDNGRCVLTGLGTMLERTPHHCFFKSEYFSKDRDGEWNLTTIGIEPHDIIHHRKHKGGRDMERRCKEIALKRYTGEHKKELLKIMRVKRFSS